MSESEVLSLDSGQLTALPGEQARAILIRVLDAFERGELANFDHLMLLGIRLASSGHNDLDLAAVEWVSAKPSAARLDILCTLLSGLWKHSIRGTRINAAALDCLIRVHEIIRPDEAVEYQFLLALSEASAGGTLRQIVRGILEGALERHLSNPQLDRILKDVIRESLRK
jgi:hypothetical protein